MREPARLSGTSGISGPVFLTRSSISPSHSSFWKLFLCVYWRHKTSQMTWPGDHHQTAGPAGGPHSPMPGASWAYLPPLRMMSKSNPQNGQRVGGDGRMESNSKVCSEDTIWGFPVNFSASLCTLFLADPTGNVCRVVSCGLSGEGRMLRMSWGKLAFKQPRD